MNSYVSHRKLTSAIKSFAKFTYSACSFILSILLIWIWIMNSYVATLRSYHYFSSGYDGESEIYWRNSTRSEYNEELFTKKDGRIFWILGMNHQSLEEETFIQYFDYKKMRRKWHPAPSYGAYSYSILNNNYQMKTGEKLQKYPRITLLLKSYESGYQRKTANTSTKEQILLFLTGA